MKNLTNIVFYYTVFALTILTLASFFYLDMPYSLIQAVLISPSALFFWLRITDPEHATEASWSGRLITVVVILISVSLFSFYIFINKPKETIQVTSSDVETASLSAQIKALEDQVQNFSEEKKEIEESTKSGSNEIIDLINSLPSTIPSPTPTATPRISLGNVQVKQTVGTNIYQEANQNSKIIGIAEGGKKYIYYEKVLNWYLIEFEESLTGWVQSKEVLEVK